MPDEELEILDPLRPDADKPSIEQDTADAAGSRRKEDRLEREFREQAEFWDFVFKSRIGRFEIWKLLCMGHPFETRFAAGPAGFPDPNATWYAKGEQDLALRQFWMLERANRDGVWKMREEHDSRLAKPGKPKPVGK
jgi:hypothetical protein